ncbi:ribbon-helix-helix protein, CopG family [Priestia megaterium]|uniref:ribbon-helix-helix protein, CopG family n=1 Tax=Priestia megaterium TaxID=1404 RepID=UPI003008F9FA
MNAKFVCGGQASNIDIIMFLCINIITERMIRLPKIVDASEIRVSKTFRIDPKTLETIESLKEKEGLSQSKIIDIAIELLKQKVLSS